MKKNLVLVLVLSVLFAGCGQEYSAEKEFFRASKILKSIDTEALKNGTANIKPETLEPAVLAFKQVADRFPSTPKAAESLYIISELKLKQNRFGEAIEALKTIATNFSMSGTWALDARYRIAQLYEKEGEWEKAEAAYWETANQHYLNSKGLYAPIYLLSHYKTFRNFQKEHETYDMAVDFYERKIKELGNIQQGATLKYFLGLAHLATDHDKEAVQVFEEIVHNFPNNNYGPLSLMTLGEIAWKQKNLKKATTYYEQFFKIYGGHPLAAKAAVRLGVLYTKQKDYDRARTWLEETVKRYYGKDAAQTSEIRLLIAKNYQEQGEWPKAESIYNEIKTKYPLTPAGLQVPLLVASYYQKTSQTKKADQILEEALSQYKQIEINNPDVRIAKYAKQFANAAYAQKGEWDEVISNIDQDLKRQTVDTNKGNYLFLEAMVTANGLKDVKKALELYKKFLIEYPKHPLAPLAERNIQALSAPKVNATQIS